MTTKQMAVGLAVMVLVLVGCMAVAFRLGRSSAAPNIAPTVAGAAAAPDPKLAALDDRVAQYNISLRQIEQDEQQRSSLDQQEKSYAGLTDENASRAFTATVQQAIALSREQETLKNSAAALYRQIQSDPGFLANYRETTYTALHGTEQLDLRYIERR